jgi:hypothetical protein
MRKNLPYVLVKVKNLREEVKHMLGMVKDLKEEIYVDRVRKQGNDGRR